MKEKDKLDLYHISNTKMYSRQIKYTKMKELLPKLLLGILMILDRELLLQ